MKHWTPMSSLISWKGIQDLTSAMCAGLFPTALSLDSKAIELVTTRQNILDESAMSVVKGKRRWRKSLSPELNKQTKWLHIAEDCSLKFC